MVVPNDDAQLLTDRGYLTEVQYRTDANLAARQSVYAYQVPKIDLPAAVLDLARLAGTETVAEIGCGNGIYLAELAAAGTLAGCWAPTCPAACSPSPAPGRLALGWWSGTRPACRSPTTWPTSRWPHTCSTTYRTARPRPASSAGSRAPAASCSWCSNAPDHLQELRELVEAVTVSFGREAGATWAQYQVMTVDRGAELLAGLFSKCTGMTSPVSC